MTTENLQVNEAEIKTIDAAVTDIETRIVRLVINSQDSLTIAGDILAEIKQETKHTKATLDEWVKPLKEQKEKLEDIFKPKIKELEKLKVILEDNMRPYQLRIIKEKEEIAAEARKKELEAIQARADAALAEAAKTNSEVKLNTAIDITEYKTEVEAREIKGHSRTTGGMGQMTARKEWDFKIVNADLIPREFCTPDESKIRKFVKQNKELAKISGVETFETIVNTNR